MIRTALRWLVMLIVGFVAGIIFGLGQIRYSTPPQVRQGIWVTGVDVGTANAGPLTRAVVALRGLLALPKSEARYFNAATDSLGEPLSGRCRYRIDRGPLSARWWSITVYDAAGWLIVNPYHRYSLGSNAVQSDAQGRWSMLVAPAPETGAWIPTGTRDHFELTLRTYRPTGALQGDLAGVMLPSITKLGCSA